jgi:hypothetical protein
LIESLDFSDDVRTKDYIESYMNYQEDNALLSAFGCLLRETVTCEACGNSKEFYVHSVGIERVSYEIDLLSQEKLQIEKLL